MLYLDSSVLVKRYVREDGSAQLEKRLQRGDKVFTSSLSFAEVLATLARRLREGLFTSAEFASAKNEFLWDWTTVLQAVGLDVGTLSNVETLVERYPLRGADAVHLSSALWLRDMWGLGAGFLSGESSLEFGVADIKLAAAAKQCGLRVFNPAEAN